MHARMQLKMFFAKPEVATAFSAVCDSCEAVVSDGGPPDASSARCKDGGKAAESEGNTSAEVPDQAAPSSSGTDSGNAKRTPGSLELSLEDAAVPDHSINDSDASADVTPSASSPSAFPGPAHSILNGALKMSSFSKGAGM